MCSLGAMQQARRVQAAQGAQRSTSTRLQAACSHSAGISRRQQPAAQRTLVAAAAASPAGVPTAAPAAAQQPQQQPRSAKDVVTAFYAAYNTRDLAAIEGLIADDISYHDLVYEEPHEGREGVMAWLHKVRQYAPDDLLFVIEDITSGDDGKVGVMWHVECGDGVYFPFSRGCSFITVNADGRIATVRDVVEPATKPGDATLQLLGTLTPLIRQLGPRSHPDMIKQLPLAAAGIWAAYAVYVFVALGDSGAPGAPAWATPPETFKELLNESVNIWWINEGLASLGLSPIPNTPSHPVSEALFNFVLAWAAMFVPVILTDGAAQKVPNKAAWATGLLFLTNIFFIPFMALRAAPEPLQPTVPAPASTQQQRRPRPRKVAAPGSQALPGWGPAVGAFGAAMGIFCIGWAAAGRPELAGDLAARLAHLQTEVATNRVSWAFCIDCVIFSVFQQMLLAAAPAGYRYVPFFGLAAWLLAGGGSGDEARQHAAADAAQRQAQS